MADLPGSTTPSYEPPQHPSSNPAPFPVDPSIAGGTHIVPPSGVSPNNQFLPQSPYNPQGPYGELPHDGELQEGLEDPQFDMSPPPESEHATFADLHAFAQSHASQHGYALSINTTAKNRARVKLACVCYGAPKNTHHLTDETRVRKKRTSSKTGCRMWVEGKKQPNGTWILKIGEPNHNHPGRSAEDWAVHRRRTWGLGGTGGGIVAGAVPAAQVGIGGEGIVGATVWRIVEEEMEKINSENRMSGEASEGKEERGVGRTVRVLQEKLPGIQIFKRDIYNIRAQIKKARSKAGAQATSGADEHGLPAMDGQVGDPTNSTDPLQIDPMLIAQFNAAQDARGEQEESPIGHTPSTPSLHHQAPTAPMGIMATPVQGSDLSTDEVLQLRMGHDRMYEENSNLKNENERLRAELEQAKMQLMLNGQGSGVNEGMPGGDQDELSRQLERPDV
jgi:hypothetical protein